MKAPWFALLKIINTFGNSSRADTELIGWKHAILLIKESPFGFPVLSMLINLGF